VSLLFGRSLFDVPVPRSGSWFIVLRSRSQLDRTLAAPFAEL